MFDKYYKSEYLKIKEYEKISNVSFEKFVLNIIKTESKKYPKRKESTKWIMMLLSFCFGLFIIVEAWNLLLWLGRDILSIKALLILGIPSIFVSGILLRWIFSNDLTHIDLAKFFIIDNNIALSELYLEHITSTEIIAEYSKDCTDDIIKILSDAQNSNLTEKDKILTEEENLEIEESIEDKNIVLAEQLDDSNISKKELDEDLTLNSEDDTNSDNEISLDNQIKEDVESKNDIEIKEDIDEDIVETTNDEIILDLNTSNNIEEEIHESKEKTNIDITSTSENLQIETETKYDKYEISKILKETLIRNSLNNISSAKILLKDIISIDTFEKTSPEDSLNKSLKKSVYNEFKDFINDESIIW